MMMMRQLSVWFLQLVHLAPILFQTSAHWVSSCENACPASVVGSTCPTSFHRSAHQMLVLWICVSHAVSWFCLSDVPLGTLTYVRHFFEGGGESTSSLFDTARCSWLILYIYCFSLWIRYFSKEHWFLLLENVDASYKIWVKDVTNSIFHLGLKVGGLPPKTFYWALSF